MRSFIAACVVAIVVAACAAWALEAIQKPAETAYASSSGVRI